MTNHKLQKKVCMLGKFGVGKTSLTRRFVEGVFDESYLSTIGVRVSQKMLPPVETAPGQLQQLTLLIWDIEGFEEDSPQITNYFTGASGALVIGDLSRPESIAALPEIAKAFRKVCPDAPLVFAGNKIDLVGDGAEAIARLQTIAKSLEAPYVLSSAKEGRNVEACFSKLGRLIVG